MAAVDGGCVFARLRKERNGVVSFWFCLGQRDVCSSSAVCDDAALMLFMQEEPKKSDRVRSIAMLLRWNARPLVRDWGSYLVISGVCLLGCCICVLFGNGNALEHDQETGARIYIFPDILPMFVQPQHYCRN